MRFDFAIVGGGIVGLATVRAILKRQPGARVLLLEKEARFAAHQTGHNSGVIHAGVYYAPGSLKARLCRDGAIATKAFCRQNDIPFDVCGKLIVATNALELERMQALEGRARQNGIEVERLTTGDLRVREPNIAGVGALFVAATGIVSYSAICAALAREVTEKGAQLRLGSKVRAIAEDPQGVTIETEGETVHADRLIACAGLQSDRVARMAGLELDCRIVPFRGEYYVLPPERNHVVRHLIYPVPDPDLPFLGIHLTRMIDGRVTVGPNAVLGFSREGYGRGAVSASDLYDMARFPGFWKTLGIHWKSGLREFRNALSRKGYLAECRKYCPSLTLNDLQPYPAGIRAQAVARDGTLIHDFLFAQSPRMLHVVNAPSPAATSAFPIAEMILDRMLGVTGQAGANNAA